MSAPGSEYRFDPLRRDHVIVAPRRGERPRPAGLSTPWEEAPPCPFCPGNEAATPPEIMALRPDGSKPDTPGWQVRVVPNRYPAVSLNEQDSGADPASAAGSARRTVGYGSHEVVVETPDHAETMVIRPIDRLHLTLIVYRERLRSLRTDPRLAHVQIFKNVGRAAGATRQHPHSQILAVSKLPRVVASELDALDEHRRRTSRCLVCQTVEGEIAAGSRLLEATDRYAVFCPWASRLPFETCIVPTAHRRDYAESSDEELASLARVLKQTLGALTRVLEQPSFNLVLHTAPTPAATAKGGDVEFHWRLELLPRVANLAGFEWGTGMYINHLPPEEAALRLRTAK